MARTGASPRGTSPPLRVSSRKTLGRSNLAPSLASIVLARAQLRQDAEVFQGRRVSLGLSTSGDVLQQPPHDLPAARLRQSVGEADGIGPRELPDLLVDVGRER